MNVETVQIRKNTDQLNYEDFLGGKTMIVTITKVEEGRKEGQYDLSIEGDARFWRPPPTVLKQLQLAYGDVAADWIGKSAALYGDPDVKMKGVKVGGIRVSHLSHIAGPLTATLAITRGQSGTFTILPLPDAPASTPPAAEPTAEDVAACNDIDQLKVMWRVSGAERRAQIKARSADLANEPAATQEPSDDRA